MSVYLKSEEGCRLISANLKRLVAASRYFYVRLLDNRYCDDSTIINGRRCIELPETENVVQLLHLAIHKFEFFAEKICVEIAVEDFPNIKQILEYYSLDRAFKWMDQQSRENVIVYRKLVPIMNNNFWQPNWLDNWPKIVYYKISEDIVKLCKEDDCVLQKIIQILLDSPKIAKKVLSNLKIHHLKFGTILLTPCKIYSYKSSFRIPMAEKENRVDFKMEHSIHYTEWEFVLMGFLDYKKKKRIPNINTVDMLCNECQTMKNYTVLKISGFQVSDTHQHLKQPICIKKLSSL